MSRNAIRILLIIFLVLLVILLAITLFYSHMVSLINVKVLSVKQYGIEDFCQMTGLEHIPSEIENFTNNQEHSQYIITEATIRLNNQSSHTFRWNAINAKDSNILVYYPYTIMIKNHISEGPSIWTVMLVSARESSDKLTDDKKIAKIDLVIERPLLKLNKSIEVSFE